MVRTVNWNNPKRHRQNPYKLSVVHPKLSWRAMSINSKRVCIQIFYNLRTTKSRHPHLKDLDKDESPLYIYYKRLLRKTLNPKLLKTLNGETIVYLKKSYSNPCSFPLAIITSQSRHGEVSWEVCKLRAQSTQQSRIDHYLPGHHRHYPASHEDRSHISPATPLEALTRSCNTVHTAKLYNYIFY